MDHRDEKGTFKQGLRGNDGFVPGNRAAVAFSHFLPHNGMTQIKILELLEATEFDARAFLVDLPGEFRTVDPSVIPLKGEIVRSPEKPLSNSPHVVQLRVIQWMPRAFEPLHDHLTTLSAPNPISQWRESHGVYSLEHPPGTLLPKQQTHVAPPGMGRKLNRLALGRTRCLEKHITFPQPQAIGIVASPAPGRNTQQEKAIDDSPT